MREWQVTRKHLPITSILELGPSPTHPGTGTQPSPAHLCTSRAGPDTLTLMLIMPRMPYVRQGDASPTQLVLEMTTSCVPSNQRRFCVTASRNPMDPFSSAVEAEAERCGSAQSSPHRDKGVDATGEARGRGEAWTAQLLEAVQEG